MTRRLVDPADASEEGSDERSGGRSEERSRGQLVLAAAAVVAIALVPVVLAYLQLGYHPDVRAGSEYADPGRDAERMLSRSVHEAALSANGSWSNRAAVVDDVRDRLAPRLETLRESRVERGTAYAVTYNQSAARAWAGSNCPSGPNRQFGDCEADRGVVVQERAGETHVLAVAFDVTVTTERGRIDLTLVVRSVGGTAG